MKCRTYLASLLLAVAGWQTALAQQMVVTLADGKVVKYSVSKVEKVTFNEVTEYEYVDLGLPSGTLWATCNVGADNPEEYGDFFAWGETSPKTAYNIDNYLYYKDGGWTKYRPWGADDSDFIDDLTTLLPEDDAATANWGSEWQTPTQSQWWELIGASYTTREWTTYRGVPGLMITGKNNGRSIFLPVYASDTNSGFYWSSSLYEMESDMAFEFYFYKNEYVSADDRDYRYNGNRVRPVRVEKGEPIPVSGIALSETSLSLEPGETAVLTATVLPADAREQAVLWESSNPSVATVDQSGKVTAVAPGISTIICSATDGSGVTAECQVTVDAAGQTYTVNGVSFKMIAVEGGTFQMGSKTGDFSEMPVHQVTLSSFSIGQTEVTQELWQAVMGSNPSFFTGNKLPVEQVNWNDCQTFITKLNQLTGKTFRLPTEAEWEYAARGGNQSKGYTYSGSNTIGDVAWYGSNSGNSTHPVATKAANELGLYDMSGNVYEWCQDWYDKNYYSISPVNNPTGPSSGSNRVRRGGCWYNGALTCCVAGRYSFNPTNSNFDLGLRLAQ